MVEFGFETTGDDVVAAFPGTLKGKRILITGPSWGSIGSETAITLAKGPPAMIVLLGRDIEKIQPVIDKVQEIDPGVVTKFVPVHLDSLRSVRHSAQQILDDDSIPKIDTLINNAGIMACPYSKTEDGIERHSWLPVQSARVINVSSYGNVLSDVLEDPNFNEGEEYNSFISYGQSKTANVLMAVGLNSRLQGKGLKAFALDPGSVPSNLRRFMTPDTIKEGMEVISKSAAVMPQRKTQQQGCAITIRAVIDPDLTVDGSIFLSDTQVTSDPKVVASYSLDVSNTDRVWRMSEQLVGQRFEF
ncbi:hypothetical protein PV05_08550 [Exophiala xenobiotica]|uniref:Uncharacterized protein n=1 Tax=Exophiala xenobiotica TaxID=348802 RepID=A0A0D2EC76_9EURO|nr:uncharacterized protein PV05_08550 [Exophiala xenobiotica]KIW52943.1 hypothetical protein PV05_08550 [Exophiala xenobiotica]